MPKDKNKNKGSTATASNGKPKWYNSNPQKEDIQHTAIDVLSHGAAVVAGGAAASAVGRVPSLVLSLVSFGAGSYLDIPLLKSLAGGMLVGGVFSKDTGTFAEKAKANTNDFASNLKGRIIGEKASSSTDSNAKTGSTTENMKGLGSIRSLKGLAGNGYTRHVVPTNNANSYAQAQALPQASFVGNTQMQQPIYEDAAGDRYVIENDEIRYL